MSGRRRQQYPADIIARLREQWPAAFSLPPKPLALGIGRRIAEQLGGHSRDLDRAIGWWCSRWSYQRTLADGGLRYGLDGAADGEVSPEHQAQARARLNGRGPPR
jgi:ProP effector